MWNAYKRLIGNSVFANVVLVALVVLAVLAGSALNRESSPAIDYPLIEVRIDYPGADPLEVEEGVAQKLEAAVDSIQGVKRYYTTATEGSASLRLEIADAYDVRDIKDKIENAIAGIEDLPDKAEPATVVQLDEDEEVMLVIVWGELPERQLKELAERVRRDIEALPDASLAYLYGAREYELHVEVSEDRLRQLGLTLFDVSRAIRESSRDGSAGALELEGESIRLRTAGEHKTADAIGNVVVKASPSGEVVRVRDIAVVRDDFVELERLARFNGKPAVAISVQKSPGEDSITIYEQVMDYIERTSPTLPENVRLTAGFDNVEFIRSQINMITKNGLLGLLLVVVTLWLFLEPRLAFWVAMGIPISLGGSLVLLWLIGASLNQISLIGMIVVMGIIVDDAIVVGESIFVHRQRGKAPIDAAIEGLREVAIPVMASALTTIAAFAPLMFIPGIFGQFSKQMPYVVIAALIVSLLECFFLLPAHLTHERPTHKHLRSRHPLVLRKKVADGLDRFVERYYAPTVRWSVNNRYITLCGAIAIILLAIGLVGGGFVPVLMWPGVEADFAQAYVEFPPGTPRATVFESIERVEQAARALGNRLETHNGDPFVQHSFADAPSRVDTGGRVLLELTPTANRDVTSSEFMAQWAKEIGPIPGALVVSFEGAQIGSGPGEDIEFWLLGANVAAVRAAADELKKELGRYEGVYAIKDNFRPGKKELEVSLKPSATTLGLTLEDLNRHLYAGYYGEEAFRIQRGREDVRVKVRYPRSERESLERVYASRVHTPSGVQVPFLAVADVRFTEGVSTISGIDGIRGVRVSAMVDRKTASPAEINAQLMESRLPQLVRQHPGVSWSLSGAEQENRAVMEAMRRNLIISLMTIFVILCTVFRSYAQPFIIMLVIPYGVVGAFLGHLALGLPLSFLSLGGIVALCGVLVNDSIVLIERANANLALGMSLFDSVCQAGQRRFRAILLTSLSTCVGLFPLIMETDLQAQVVIPMAVSIASGVAFGTLLTLVLIPAFLVIMNDMRRAAYRLARGSWPTPEELEPATQREAEPLPAGAATAASAR